MSASTNRLRTLYQTADARFRARTPRERVLIASMALAAVAALLDGVMLRPLEAERARVVASTAAAGEQIQTLERHLDAVRHPIVDPAEQRRRDEIRQLEHQLAAIDERIHGAVSKLVPPEAAVQILEEFLADDSRLELVNLKSEPPRRLGSEGTATANLLFAHGLTIEVKGDFAATLDYLRRIEQSEWQLLWDRLDYRVESFPDAHVTIELHTLSEQEAWVGV